MAEKGVPAVSPFLLNNTGKASWKYRCIAESDPDLLNKRVSSHLNDGWELHGTVVMTTYYDQIWFAQAMVKLDPWNNN